MSSRQSGAQLLVVRKGLLREDLGTQGAAVLGVAIDVATLQRAPQHPRASELAPVPSLLSGIARQLRGNLAENHRLRENLRTDHDVGRSVRRNQRG
jgi:hypothetical protein